MGASCGSSSSIRLIWTGSLTRGKTPDGTEDRGKNISNGLAREVSPWDVDHAPYITFAQVRDLGQGAAEVGLAGMPQARAENVTDIPKSGMRGHEQSMA
jgi:hypothetical protein